MNKTPSILVDTGFEVDQNGALTEIVPPNVVTTLNAPRKVTFNGTTLNWIPSTVTALQEFSSTNMASISSTQFKQYTSLVSVTMRTLADLNYQGDYNGCFYGCGNLETVDMPDLLSITCPIVSAPCGAFYNCVKLHTVNMPKLTTIVDNGGTNPSGAFYNCTSLVSISLPHLTSIIRNSGSGCGAFNNCIGLQFVTLGSDGHAVSSLDSQAFKNCTQSGLTITIYTSGGAALSGSPWGATNATIVYEEA